MGESSSRILLVGWHRVLPAYLWMMMMMMMHDYGISEKMKEKKIVRWMHSFILINKIKTHFSGIHHDPP